MTGIRHPSYAPRITPRERTEIEALKVRLAADHSPRVPRSDVERAVDQAWDDLRSVNRRSHVPLLVTAAARRRIEGHRPAPPIGPVDARRLVPRGHLRRPYPGHGDRRAR